MRQRGAAMLYAVLLSVVCTALVAGTVRLASLSANDQVRRERHLRARAFADEQLALLRSTGKLGSLVVPGSANRSGSGMSLTAQYSASGVTAGVVNVEQTVTISGMNFFFRDHVAVPAATQRFSFAAQTFGSDTILNGDAGATKASGAPNWDGANMDATTSSTGATTLSANDFSNNVYVTNSSLSAMLSELGLTATQFADYDLIAFSVAGSTTPVMTNTTWEFWKRNLRIRVAANGTGTFNGTISATRLQSMFGLGTSPFGSNTSVRVVLFNFDLMSGGTALKNDSGQLRAFIRTTAGAAAPIFDGIARLDNEESTPLLGAFIESGARITTNGLGGMSTILTRGGMSFSNNANSAQTDYPIGTNAGNNIAQYTGNLIPPTTGNYQFRITTDDGARLWVGGVNRISTWRAQAPATYTTGDIALVANTPVPICFEWYDSGGQEARRVQWRLPNGTWEVIPDENVRPTRGTVPVGRGYWSFNDNVSTSFTWDGLRTNNNGPFGQPNANGIVSNQYLGDFGGNNEPGPTLTVLNVPAGRILLTYEIYIAGTWEATTPQGPDYVQLLANGTQIMQILGTNNANTELSTTMPFASTYGTGNWRIMRSEFDHAGGTLTLKWQKSSPNANNSVNDESFLLDNVSIRRFR